VTLVALALTAGPVCADAPDVTLPATLDLDGALAFFRAHGFDLLIAEAAVDAAQGDVVAARAIPNPSLALGYGRSFYVSCTGACPAVPGAYTASLSDQAAIEDSLSGKRRLRTAVADAALAVARLGRADAERTLVFQVEAQFAQVLVAQRTAAFATEVADGNAQMLAKMEEQAAQGKIADADVLRVKVAKLEAEQARDQAIQAARKARADLAFLLGVRGPVPDFTVAEPELEHYAEPPALVGATRDSLLELALSSRPDLRAQEAQVEGAGAQLTLDRRLRFPDLALSLSYTSQGGSPDTSITPPTFSIGVSGTLPVLYQRQGEIAKATAQLRAQQLVRDKQASQVANDVETAWADYEASRALVQRMEDGTLLATAKAAKDAAYVQWQKGAATIVDYLIAQSQYIATNVEYLTDVASYWTSVFELERAVGRPLR
jgi:cobalt-zinc-cadmium efflux system outer membrane protein